MAYPDSLDTLPTFVDGTSKRDTTPGALLDAAEMTAIVTAITAIQAELGLTPSGALATVAARLATLAPLDSPALTGNPTAPTQAPGNNSTRIATTAFVEARASTIRGGNA